jgi:hypothetical protein
VATLGERLLSNPLSVYLSVMSLLFLAVGARISLARLKLRMKGVHAQGIVVGLQERRRAHRGEKLVFMPIVRFSAGSTVHSFQSATGRSSQSYSIGDPVKIIYLPTNPQLAEIDRGLRIWIAPGSVVAMGLSLLTIALKAGR